MKGQEDIDIELRLSCSAVTEKSRNSSCLLNLFSCSETTIRDAESSGIFKGAAYMFSSPEASDLIQAPKKKVFKECREQDLLGRFMEGSRSSSSSKEENSVTSCSAVDCTLSLGMPNTITNGDRESSYNTMAVPFSELSSTSNNIHGSQFYKSCWNTTTTSSNATSWLLDSSQKLMGSKNILPSRNHPPYGTVFRSQVSARLPTNNTTSTNYINNGYGGSSRVVQQQPQMQKRNAISQDAKGNSISRECCKCKTTTTPLWRNGPKGAKSLCNACGIRYKKEERRAASAMAAAAENASRPNSNVVDYSNSSRPLKRTKLQGIGAKDFSLL